MSDWRYRYNFYFIDERGESQKNLSTRLPTSYRILGEESLKRSPTSAGPLSEGSAVPSGRFSSLLMLRKKEVTDPFRPPEYRCNTEPSYSDMHHPGDFWKVTITNLKVTLLLLHD